MMLKWNINQIVCIDDDMLTIEDEVSTFSPRAARVT